MTPEEKAYVAGIVDGEGNISKFGTKGYGHIGIYISNTDLSLLQWIQNTLVKDRIRAKIYIVHKIGTDTRNSVHCRMNGYRLCVQRQKEANHLAALLLPYLRIEEKRERLRAMLVT
jgi:hypothetical protein